MKKLLLKSLIFSSIFIGSGIVSSCSSSDDSKNEETTNNNELRVVALVLDSNGDALNVQEAKANSTKDYVIAEGGYKHRVLIEDFTGAWCGWCPRVSHSIEELEKSNTNDVIAVALHNGDKLAFNPYQSNLSGSLWDKFGVASNQRGYPFAVINRNVEWAAKSGNSMDKTQVTSLIKSSSPIGIKINSELGETSGKVKISFKFNQSYSGLKYVVYIIQDGIVLSQENYTSNYDGVKKIKDFNHHGVVKATNNIFGENITNSTSGSEFTTEELNFTYKKF